LDAGRFPLGLNTQHEQDSEAGSNTKADPGKVVAPCGVKDEACQRRTDHPTDRGNAHDQTDKSAERRAAEVLLDEHRPEGDRPPETGGEEDKEEDHAPPYVDIAQGEHSQAHQSEGDGDDMPLVEEVGEPTQTEAPDDAQNGDETGDQTGGTWERRLTGPSRGCQGVNPYYFSVHDFKRQG
jgi:hypothetical protein